MEIKKAELASAAARHFLCECTSASFLQQRFDPSFSSLLENHALIPGET